jgi:transcriptional regulator with XRE-family HTH domain
MIIRISYNSSVRPHSLHFRSPLHGVHFSQHRLKTLEAKERLSRDPLNELIGAHLRRHRINQSLTLEAVAEAIGTSFQAVQKYEQGTNRLSLAVFLRITYALGLRPSQFLRELFADLKTRPEVTASLRKVRHFADPDKFGFRRL